MKFVVHLALLIIFTSIHVNAQKYISSVTVPDVTIPLITDTTLTNLKYERFVKSDEMKKHLTTLASPEYEGRETGERGNILAAKYIADHFKNIGLKPAGEENYYQKINFTYSSWDDTDVFVNGERYKHLWEYIAFPTQNDNLPLVQGKEVVFMGYGIEDPKYSDYDKKSYQGKIIIINKGEPMKSDSTYWISGTRTPSDWSTDLSRKLKLAKSKGAALVLIIEDDIKKLLGENRRNLLGPSVELGDFTKRTYETANHAFISTNVAKAIFGKNDKKIIDARKKIETKGKFKPVFLKALVQVNMLKKTKVISGFNVLGYLEGGKKSDELIIVTAHYDHLGKKGDQIYHGADDNGSGTSTVLSIASAMAKAKEKGVTLDRSILFMLVTGEEKGLLGSEYYTKFPVFDLKKTMVNVNVDMVGRLDKKYENNPNYIYVIGSDRLASTLHSVNETVNQNYTQLWLDYTYNSETDPNQYYFRSDHYNFAKNGIPAIFFFNGVHADYHQPTDTVDKINFRKMEKVGKHIYHLIWELATRPEKIEVDRDIK